MSDYDERPLTTGDWFLMILILGVPVLNIIMYLVWAFGHGNVNRRNFCRASLIWALIAMVIVIAIGVAGR